jgi:cell division protease FtsH
MEEKHKFSLWYFVIATVLLLAFQVLWAANQQIETIAFSQFETLLHDGALSEVMVADKYIQGTLKNPGEKGQKYALAVRVDTDMARLLNDSGVKFSGLIESTWLKELLSWIIPIVLFFGLWQFLVKRMGGGQGLGGLMAIGQSKAKIFVEKDIKITFDDVAGVDEAKEELREVVAFLKDPKGFGRLGAHVPKGILLVGPPGTGKTLLARAMAGEANVAFFSINGSEFVEMFVGVGAARVRDLFQQARQNAPCIIFIDELDALGRARTMASVTGGNDEKEQTLNQLLSELDGFDPSNGVVLLAATNRPEILDPALLRSGRFDLQIVVDRPDKKGREAILKVHLKKVTLGADVVAADIAALTPGFTGADLANLVNEAAMLATRRSAAQVSMEDFSAAIERIIAGPEKRNRLLNVIERKTVAYHEMGHALVAMSLPHADPVKKISIIPRGVGALDYTIQQPIEDRYLMTATELECKMAVLMGGRAAEWLTFHEISTGAADDLQKATEIARAMVTLYGMDKTLGQAVYAEPHSSLLNAPGVPHAGHRASDATEAVIDQSVRGLVNTAFERASKILTKNQSILVTGAEQLLSRETLTSTDLETYGIERLKVLPS